MSEILKRSGAVIFDMDGVLVDTEPIHMEVEQQIFNELGIRVSLSYHQTFVGRSSREMWEEIILNFGLPHAVSALSERKREVYLDHLENLPELPLIPGVRLLLEQLKDQNKKLALASSSAMPNIQYITQRTGLDSFFDIMVSGNDLPKSKPDPAIFIQAAELLNIPPDKCVVVEDAMAGVKAAKAAGMQCIGFIGAGSHHGQDLSSADIIIRQYLELVV